ncbi:NAD(P)/FAD-dependent oxidoreductase [Streptomyces sp. NBC_01565]|uniref:NAD(P)/FAD-dependent oxidoreductase n=1 Tax=unclassified Streptomyces TaxID=2593676 RepID=UPI0022517FED|nr:NAD(P)/FAD-dependent oxidoreductase [Streptomyces sp. NBC_01565]MCX4546357.1 NAD(P)/FAD-dependent oxidoreductase [Streptomyces sp. NBC_01565]
MTDAALPVIVLSDSDPFRRHETAELVQSWYRTSFRVLQVGGPAEVVRALRSLAERQVPVAAVLSDEAPDPAAARHSGVRWLPLPEQGKAEAAAPTETATGGENPAEYLRAALDDSLCTWNADCQGGLATAEVRGSRFSPAAYAVRDFLGRSGVIFRWLAEEESRDAPVTVRLGDGTEMVDPSISELAERLGLIRPAEQDQYDVAVIGGGPGGLSAAVYAAAEGMSVVVIEDDAPGGQAGSTSRIENYLGFPVGLTGGDLAQRALQQARRARVEWQPTRVASRVTPTGTGSHTVEFVKAGTDEAASVTAASVVVATGVDWNRLTAPGVDRLLNSGVYYGSCLSDAPSAAGEDVYMVGAGNSAGQAALYFTRYARSVTLLVRGTDLGASMSSYLVQRIERTPGLQVLLGTEVAECLGETTLTGLRLRDRAGSERTVSAHCLYVLIGGHPSSDWLGGALKLDDRGYVLTGSGRAGPDALPMETSLPGVFAVGDVRSGSVKRVGAAVGEGAAVAQSLVEYRRRHPDRFRDARASCGF